MKNHFAVLFSLISSCSLFSQVINIETKLFYNDTVKWCGEADFNFNVAKNPTRTLYFGNRVRVQYQKKIHRLIFINDFSVSEVANKTILNAGYQHLRYTYRHHPVLNFEAFIQTQYNKPMKMDFRGLIGAGERFKIISKGKNRMFYGLAIMYEHERDDNEQLIYDDLRFSTYLNFYWDISTDTYFVNTFYYQPNVSDFDDYRFADEGSIVIKIKKWLSFATSLNYLYDSKQPKGIPNSIYEWRNRLMFVF